VPERTIKLMCTYCYTYHYWWTERVWKFCTLQIVVTLGNWSALVETIQKMQARLLLAAAASVDDPASRGCCSSEDNVRPSNTTQLAAWRTGYNASGLR